MRGKREPYKHLRGGYYDSPAYQKRKAYQAAYAKARREKLKELGLCPRCGRDQVQIGRALCAACMLERNQLHGGALERKDRDTRPRSERRKLQYQERKALGKCVRCGKKKAKKGHVECKACLEKSTQYKAIAKERSFRAFWEGLKAKARQYEVPR